MLDDHRNNLWYPDRLRIWMILLMVLLTDIFLYRSPDPGSIPLTVFYLGLLGISWPRRTGFLSRTAWAFWILELLLCGIGIFYYAGFSAVAAGCFSILVFRMVCREEKADSSVWQWGLKLASFVFSFLFDGLYQLWCARRAGGDWKSPLGRFLRGALLWVVPVIVSLMFLVFFSEANPLLGRWTGRIVKWLGTIDFPSVGHIFFWVTTALGLAALTGMTLWSRIYAEHRDLDPEVHWKELSEDSSILLAKIMTRGLVLFNLVFLLQNLLDAEYLWAGAALPGGVTYAEYAHRGAYPLIATALIAGGLTLLAFSGKCSGPAWKWPRILVYIWLAQNVFLVASSLLRLEKYVSVYSLTGLRGAAGIWMAVVAVGLCLIFFKILRGKSLCWLFWANGAQLLAVLLLVMLFDTSRFIAEYNFAHCRENAAPAENGLQPASLDVDYLKSLLPASLPVLIRARKAGIWIPGGPDVEAETGRLKKSVGSWRSWSPAARRILRAVDAENTRKTQ